MEYWTDTLYMMSELFVGALGSRRFYADIRSESTEKTVTKRDSTKRLCDIGLKDALKCQCETVLL